MSKISQGSSYGTEKSNKWKLIYYLSMTVYRLTLGIYKNSILEIVIIVKNMGFLIFGLLAMQRM